MAAVEPVSLTIGIVALASLFSTCIECFDYFKAGKNLEEDVEILLVKLDLEKTRLLIWGNAVGVLRAEEEGRAVELGEAPIVELVGRCLERVKSLLSNTDKLQDTYGLEASVEAEAKGARSSNIVSGNSMNVFKTSYRRFWVRFASNQTRSGLLMKTKWAVHDKPKFERLIVHLRDLIDGLNRVLPVKRETQDRIVHDDIASILDLSKLRLVQSACEESYRTWSAVASAVIEASEIGTVDRRNIEEWMMDAEGINEHPSSKVSQEGTDTISPDRGKIFHWISNFDDYTSKIYFVLTGQCMNQLSSPCELASLGKDCVNNTNIVTSQRSQSSWSIGKRIVDTLKPEDFTGVNQASLVKLLAPSGSFQYIQQNSRHDQFASLRKTVLPVATVYIYCAPCACLLATALEICKRVGPRGETFFNFLVRPDDRLMSSCCSETDRSIGLISLIEEIRKCEAPSSIPTSRWDLNDLNLMDRLWIEQRLFEIEETGHFQPSNNIINMARGIFDSHSSPIGTAGIIILGELDYCLPIMYCAPFPSKPRIPRETEIFQMDGMQGEGGDWNRTFLGTYTPALSPSGITSSRKVAPGTNTQSPASQSSIPVSTTGPMPVSFSNKRVSPPPSPAAKRQRVSASFLATGKDVENAPQDEISLENILKAG